MIAEYDGNNNLLRKYIYGPGIDQPVSMIEVAQSNAAYYYHFDALGSVVALSNANGDTVQTYQYSVYGEVAVEDANHTNPFMFAGVRYDIEIGLYYNRARYYNPFTGRFLQTDPIGYEDDLNMYRYCGNNPIVLADPTGTVGEWLEPEPEVDPCSYYEWTGEWRVSGWRGHHSAALLAGSMKIQSGRVRAALKAHNIVGTSVFIATVVFDSAVPAVGVVDVAIAMFEAYNDVFYQILNAGVFDRLKARIEDGFRAWIRVKAYKRRTGLAKIVDLFDDGWHEYWPKNTDDGWVQVKGGSGWVDLGLLQVYETPEAAMDAIREAASNLMKPRPRD